MKFTFITSDKTSGQTLLVVMMALFVLTSGFLGILSLLAQSIFLSKTVGNETIATYLAAEGVEVAKNLLDHDVYAHIAGVGTGWGTCFGLSGGDYELDYTTTNCSNLAAHRYSSDDHLVFDATTNQYLYAYNDVAGNGAPTPFTRLVRVRPDSVNPNEVYVTSIVSWSTGALTSQSVSVEDVFYNWHP